MTTEGMARFDAYHPPGRGAVDRILTAADKARAATQAIQSIRHLHRPRTLDGYPNAPVCDHCGTKHPCPTTALIESHHA